MSKEILIIGYGSIGRRHARICAEDDHKVVCVTNNQECQFPKYKKIEEALANKNPDIAIICNETSKHISTLNRLKQAKFSGPILIEKPLSNNIQEILVPNDKKNIYIAYNLRFHPIIQKIKTELVNEHIVSASYYVGMYLPDWRPGTNYRESYSAKKEEGGGVIHDLSHEVDLALWQCGDWGRVVAMGGKFSNLEINSDDVYSLMLETIKCPCVSINLNYLDRMPRRMITINTFNKTIFADLISGELIINGNLEQISVERDSTYRAQIDALIHGLNKESLCSWREGVNADLLIDAAQKSVIYESWVGSA